MNKENKIDVILVQPSGKNWQPGTTRGHSTSDAYELALLSQALKDAGVTVDYCVQRPIGTNKEFYHGTKRVAPESPSLDNLADVITKRQPKVVGLEVMSCYEDSARDLARMIKERDSKIQVVVGGYHPSGYPEMLRDSNGNVDFAVLGAGEKTLPNLVKSILIGKNPIEGRQLNTLPKLGNAQRRRAINQSAYAVFNGQDIQLASRLESDFITSFDDLSIPERKMEYQEGSVSGVLARITPDRQVMATLQTRRGCDVGCTYCASSNVYGLKGNKLFGGSNVKSVWKVVKELEYLSGNGINFIFFTDPTFNEDGRYLNELANGIIEAKKQERISQEMAFYAMFRPFSVEQMQRRGLSLSQYSALKNTGFTRIAFGVESPDDSILKLMKRSNTISDLENHLIAVNSFGMFTRGFMMYGHDRETLESMTRYVETMKNLHVDEWRLAPMTPFVGTSTGDPYLAQQEKIDFTKHDAISPIVIPKEIRTHFKNDEEAREYLFEWQKTTMKSIYCSSEWRRRLQERYRKFSELQEGMDFFFDYLKENLGEEFKRD